jgi:hypothetical protein
MGDITKLNKDNFKDYIIKWVNDESDMDEKKKLECLRDLSDDILNQMKDFFSTYRLLGIIEKEMMGNDS